ncbi:MAG: ferrous iron transport protein A [Clostridia bacterium]|nr:ferrous iron transport protein A [Clostridia bacterium]
MMEGYEEKTAIPLDVLPRGCRAVVVGLDCAEETSQDLVRFGIVPGAVIEPVWVSLFGDPRAYRVEGSVVALRNEEARRVLVAGS